MVKKHSVLRSRRCKNKVGGLLEEDQMQCLSEVNALWSAKESRRDDVMEGSSCLDSGTPFYTDHHSSSLLNAFSNVGHVGYLNAMNS